MSNRWQYVNTGPYYIELRCNFKTRGPMSHIAHLRGILSDYAINVNKWILQKNIK